VFLVIRYHGYVDRFLKRITEETDEINSSFLGLTAKFRKEITALSASLPADKESAKADLQTKLREFVRNQFRVLSTGFFTKSLSERMRLANIVDRSSNSVSLAYNSTKLTNVTDSAGRSLSFSNDASGRIVQMIDPLGRTNVYSYNSSGQLTNGVDALGTKAAYT
jgi:YD repeat-containing protein